MYDTIEVIIMARDHPSNGDTSQENAPPNMFGLRRDGSSPWRSDY